MSAVQISNLLYRYAEYLDSGQLFEAAELFRHARIKVSSQDECIDHNALLGRHLAYRGRIGEQAGQIGRAHV